MDLSLFMCKRVYIYTHMYTYYNCAHVLSEFVKGCSILSIRCLSWIEALNGLMPPDGFCDIRQKHLAGTHVWCWDVRHSVNWQVVRVFGCLPFWNEIVPGVRTVQIGNNSWHAAKNVMNAVWILYMSIFVNIYIMGTCIKIMYMCIYRYITQYLCVYT
jgi:hypothetical protein